MSDGDWRPQIERTWRGATAAYRPYEDEIMRELREKGASASELELIHLLKAEFDARLTHERSEGR